MAAGGSFAAGGFSFRRLFIGKVETLHSGGPFCGVGTLNLESDVASEFYYYHFSQMPCVPAVIV